MKSERTLRLYEFDLGVVARIKQGRYSESDLCWNGCDLLGEVCATVQKGDLSVGQIIDDTCGETEHYVEREMLVGGCDEAGRGPLAGPLVCAACVMPLGRGEMIDGVYDSKKLSELRRESLYAQIVSRAISFSFSVIDCATIDEINILNATKLGMNRAIGGLFAEGASRRTPDMVLVDAVSLPSEHKTIPLIKGDAKSYNIAAASIIAKVTRDRLMRKIGEEFPAYFFEKNKGYGTAEHIAALKEHGICGQHRKTFVKNFVADMPQK